ncbi:hypothetical protein JXB41_01005 [Candidatus Woesearchaeota archaeon]|nr:hypothetical protein [Candidatus Woesearchaeota archaeon]
MSNITNITSSPVFYNINTTSTIDATRDYFYNLPNALMHGDIASMIIALILFFILIIIINKVTSLILELLRRTVVFIIVVLVLIDFIPRYLQLLSSEGANTGTVLIGIGALVVSGIGLYIASRSLFRSAKKHIEDWKSSKSIQDAGKRTIKGGASAMESAHTENVGQIFSKDSLKSDKSLITVLIYLLVAEFGVFSSPTLSAPNIKVGVLLFLIFVVGIVLFVKKAYHDAKIGFTYLGATFVVGLFFAFILGFIWGNIPLTKLISLDFFQSDSLIALITGMSVSLFAGSKG